MQSANGTKVANSDGWDTYRADRVVIQNSRIDNTDGKRVYASWATHANIDY